MYRLLIVDDEPTIRKGMLSCIDWEKYEIEVVGEANNGADALKKALSLKPHIILTDIRMPVMDGIELSHSVREQLPDCKIVIMSGYDEFAYAKSLMRMKVTEYLLKPIDENELMPVISKLIKEIKDEEMRKLNRQTADQLLNENMPQLKMNFMSKILDGSFSDIEEMSKQADVLNLNFPVNNCEFRVIILVVDSLNATPNHSGNHELETMQDEIVDIAENLINRTASGFLCRDHFDGFVGLICNNLEQSPDTYQLGYNIRNSIKEQLGTTIFLSIGPAVQNIAYINSSYKKTLSDLDEKRYKGKRSFVQIALRYVEEHYDTDISLADVAEAAFVTPNYLSRVFKEEMRMSFVDYLNQLRVDKAKELLLHTNLKTYEIAEKVGYKDYKYFSSMLKKLTGYSPREYRKNT